MRFSRPHGENIGGFRMRLVTFFSFIGLALAVAPAALADYPVGGVQGAQGTTVSSNAALPFTGMNLVLVVVGAILLLATGLFLRRRASDH
jgi:hypothetical protein